MRDFMAWWEALDHPYLRETEGVLAAAAVLTVALLAAGLGIAAAWQKWKEGRRAKARAR